MSLITGYSSQSDDENSHQIPSLPSHNLNLAPVVTHIGLNISEASTRYGGDSERRKTFAGTIEKHFYDDTAFKNAHRTFNIKGTGETNADKHKMGESDDARPTKKQTKQIKKTRAKKGNVDSIEGDDLYKGPWASYDDSNDSWEVEEPVNGDENSSDDEATAINSISEKSPESTSDTEEPKITTELFAYEEVDYLGRTYMHVPRDLNINLTKTPGSQECFVPKKLINKWKGHERGVNKLEFFPNTGHLILSCGNDGKILLWDVYHKRSLLRGYYGHSKSVKDIAFNSSGTEFLSCSYDKTIVLWDTETGAIKKRVQLKAIPNVVKFNPNNENEFLVGLQNKKIEHYDLLENKIIQTYDHHLGAVNTITIVDDDKRFMTTSDDKSIRFWDWQINIPVKFISDPTQHSMPVAALHPSKKYVALQSMDNTIQVFSAKDKFKPNRKKTFTGHQCAGYGIGITFSPDGKILMSGDTNGNAVFWDWKTCKIVTKLKVDSKVITCIAAHPQEVSKVAVAGLGGRIYYYE